jgi:hypothetical protein
VRPTRIRASSWAAACQQKSVQRIESGDIRHRDEVVAAEIAALALDTAFLMTLAGRAKLRREAPATLGQTLVIAGRGCVPRG